MNYELLNWENDQDISADRLNHMDMGIKENDTNIKNSVSNISFNGTDTLTVTKVDGSDENIIIDTINNAIKAEQDSAGNTINKTYIPNGGYDFNSDERLTYANKNGFLIKSGIKDYGQGDTSGAVGLKIEKNTIAFLNLSFGSLSPVLSYDRILNKVTVNTPNIDADDNQIATAEFVKSQSASSDVSLLDILNQCYKKDASGLIHQFIEAEATAEEIDVQFPISFPEKCLFVGIEILNPGKDSSSNVKFETIEKTLDSVKLLKIGTGTPTISVMAVGI